jgi:hypothetical protein
MKTKYQLVLIGNDNTFKDAIINTLQTRISDLGMDISLLVVLGENNFKFHYAANAPTVGIYFGGDTINFPNLDILNILISDSNLILPAVSDIEQYKKHTPESLHPINGFPLINESNIEALVSRVMEGLSLLRLSRRLFISYKRNESTGVAIQLFEKLEQAGFDVFLDTHSVQKGDVFQDELWHRLVDTDVVVLLNTPGFLKSEWTQKELAKASAMSIGILQIIWPDHNPERSSELCIPFHLNEDNFENTSFDNVKSQLTESTISKIVNQTESLRARSLGARQDNIITEFMKSASAQSIPANLQSEKFITVIKKDGNEIIVIPTIGVPHAFTYYQSEDLIKTIKAHKSKKIFLLYDHINIKEKWLKHLDWLDAYLPISAIKIFEIDNWLKTL